VRFRRNSRIKFPPACCAKAVEGIRLEGNKTKAAASSGFDYRKPLNTEHDRMPKRDLDRVTRNLARELSKIFSFRLALSARFRYYPFLFVGLQLRWSSHDTGKSILGRHESSVFFQASM
jgi:hypothetical protein